MRLDISVADAKGVDVEEPPEGLVGEQFYFNIGKRLLG